MKAVDYYFKIEADLPEDEDAKRFAEELARLLKKSYNVRKVEVSNIIQHEKE